MRGALPAFAAAALALGWDAAARAQTCTASSTALAFGNYAPLGGSVDYSTGSVSVKCSPGSAPKTISYTITLGTGASGTFSTRTLTGTGTALDYQVYTDLLYSHVWGDGTAGTSVVTDSYLLGIVLPVTRSYTAYGRVPASQNVKKGNYTDTLNVLVTY